MGYYHCVEQAKASGYAVLSGAALIKKYMMFPKKQILD